MRGPISMTGQLGLSVLILLAAGLLWHQWDRALAWLGRAEAGPVVEAPPDPGEPVLLGGVGEAADDLVLRLVGTGRARRSVELRARADGTVVERRLSAGRPFAEGEILMRLEAERARLDHDLARVRLEEAERVAARYRRLETTGTATLATLDEVRTRAAVARLQLARAKQALADRRLLAPFDGVAGLPEVEVGDYVEEGETVARFEDASRLLIEVAVPETALARIERGLPVEVAAPAYPGERFEGEIAAVDTRVTEATRTTRVRIDLPNPDGRLRPGGAFTVHLRLPGTLRPTVPEQALGLSGDGHHVWRLDAEGRAERVPVRLVRRRAGHVLVEGPLVPGERVVVEGGMRLAPGEAVRVIGTADPTS